MRLHCCILLCTALPSSDRVSRFVLCVLRFWQCSPSVDKDMMMMLMYMLIRMSMVMVVMMVLVMVQVAMTMMIMVMMMITMLMLVVVMINYMIIHLIIIICVCLCTFGHGDISRRNTQHIPLKAISRTAVALRAHQEAERPAQQRPKAVPRLGR